MVGNGNALDLSGVLWTRHPRVRFEDPDDVFLYYPGFLIIIVLY